MDISLYLRERRQESLHGWWASFNHPGTNHRKKETRLIICV